MTYLFTGLDTHIDKGFGVTADAYKKSADFLQTNNFEHFNITQQAEMPQNYLYRHSIELYLKSLIIIFHRKLNINYGNASFDSEEPEILIKQKWESLFKCHNIQILYEYWLNHLFLPNIAKLNIITPDYNWNNNIEFVEQLSVVSEYDSDSSYFRYPISKNSMLDEKKMSMQKIKIKKSESIIDKIKESKGRIMLLLDNNDNIVEGFKQEKNILVEIKNNLKEISTYFDNFHMLVRDKLCDGM